ncbi:MAG: glycosyltransferase [Alphaproteobacteria bacterium]|nr:glycosyltransferase [Alphaproteobacteria bacterium]
MVSVILPAFNASATLRSAVQSVLDDGEREIEVIVVDDGSTDASLDILRSIPDPRLRVIAQTYNMGLPNPLNSGLEAARGRFVARMDADDVSLPGRFRAQMRAFAEDPDLVMCGTHAKLLDDASLGRSRGAQKRRGLVRSFLRLRRDVSPPAPRYCGLSLRAERLREADACLLETSNGLRPAKSDFEPWLPDAASCAS